jgi:glycine/D-amino acid oxidase-like deaminating enzyme
VSAALALERRGLDVVVLERHSLASGASGRAAGFLMRGAAENYAAAIGQYGRDVARTLWRWTEQNLQGLRSEGIESLASYRRIPSCLLALEEGELGELKQSVGLLREDGFKVEWLERGDDSAWRHGRPLGGLLNPDDAAANPIDVVRHLAAKLKLHPYENQQVESIRPGPGGKVRVRTGAGDWTAARALLALNAYMPLLVPELSAAVSPKRGQMLALAAPGASLDYSYYANHGYDYFRQLPDGTIVVGGRRQLFADREIGYEDRTTAEVQGALEAFASAMLGVRLADLTILSRWSGTMGFSPDGLPLVGPVAGDWPAGSVWFCGGYTGHGMSLAYSTSHGAVAEMLGGPPTPFPLARLKTNARR